MLLPDDFMPARPSKLRYAAAAAIGVAVALIVDFLLVPAGWRLLMGLALCLSLGFAGLFFTAMSDPRLR